MRQRLAALSRDHRVRFAVVGLAVTGVHFAVLTALLPFVIAELANALAFTVATQANFVASYSWTWAARRGPGRERVGPLLRRLALFNASALVAFGVNAVGFSLVHRLFDAPPLPSALVATVASAVVSFLVSSRLVFARRAHDGGSSSLPVAVQTVTAAADPATGADPLPADLADDLTGATAR